MIEHEAIRQLISATLDGETTPQEKELVEDHLKTCSVCQKFSHDLQKLSSALKTWTDETLSPDLEQKVTQRLTSKLSPPSQRLSEGEVLSEPALTGRVEGEETMDRKKFISFGVGSGILTLVVLSILFVQIYAQRGVQGRRAEVYSNPATPSQTNEPFAQGGLAGVAENKQDDYLKARGYATPTSPTDKLAKLEKKKEYEPYYQEITYEKPRPSDLDASIYSRDSQLKGNQDLSISAKQLGAPYPEKAKRLELAQAPSQPLVSNKVIMDEKIARMRSGQRTDLYEDSRYSQEERRIYPYYPSPQSPVVSNTEQYDEIFENPFLDAWETPLSTFSIDVDKASYANIRRFINSNQLPPRDAVRIEEMINYFQYDYPQPHLWDGPFSITTEAARCPWNSQHQLVMIGLQAKKIQSERLPPSNLVFLIDVSGSMADENKLSLLKSVFKSFVNQLRSEDRVSIVVYAGQAGLVLESTPGSYKERIMSAIDNLQAGGSTAGGEGIVLAYRIARENFISSGNNRVILATDGDFNVGVSSDEELTRLIEQKRDEGIFLTVLGVGTGNYKDSKMEKLADKGNGNYAYLDNVVEGEKVLVNEMSATLLTVAKDVKIQVEFNPSEVKAYKLIGYENRMLAKEDFNDDRKDAGEIGAGHSVTAFYEIVPADSDDAPYGYRPVVDPLKYQADENYRREPRVRRSHDLMTIKLRYKEPKEDESKLITKVVSRGDVRTEPRSENFKFASAVAEFGLLLRDSQYRENASFDHVIKSVQEAIGKDPGGYRLEFLRLVKMAEFLKERR